MQAPACWIPENHVQRFRLPAHIQAGHASPQLLTLQIAQQGLCRLERRLGRAALVLGHYARKRLLLSTHNFRNDEKDAAPGAAKAPLLSSQGCLPCSERALQSALLLAPAASPPIAAGSCMGTTLGKRKGTWLELLGEIEACSTF